MVYVVKYGNLFYKRQYSVYGGNYTHDCEKATVWRTNEGAEKALAARKEYLNSIGRERESRALVVIEILKPRVPEPVPIAD